MADDQNNHLERLIQLYENKSINFEKYFAILIGISLFIFFFMLFPYVYLQIEEGNLIKQLDIYNEETNKKIIEMTIFNETRETITVGNLTIYNQIINFKTELEELYYYLIDNKTNDNIIQNKSIAVASSCEKAYNYTHQWILCNLNKKSLDIKNKINNTLYEEIVFPIEQTNISKTVKDKTKLTTIIKNIESLLYELNFKILEPLKSTDLESSTNHTTTTIIMNQIDNIKKSFKGEVKKIYLIIDNKINEIDVEIKNISKESRNLEEKRVNLNQKKENITNLLNDFESPIGKLTVGFYDVLLLFPLILISGFLFCLSILVDANSIRKILLKNYKNPKSNEGSIRNEDIFPIFIDKTKSIKLIVLFVPLIIFVISCVILVISWIAPTENRLSYDQTYNNIFLILYIVFGVGVGFFTALKLKNY